MEEKIPTMIELIEMYKNNTLPEAMVYKYQSVKGIYTIHKDELYKEAVLTGIYNGGYTDRLLGAKTAPDNSMTGIDKINWEKNRKRR
jgi:hypothetical protein